MMKTIQSMDSSIRSQSFSSPFKTNRYSYNLQTMASFEFSQLSQTSNLLPLNTAQKIQHHERTPSLLFKIQQSNQMEVYSVQNKLQQLTLAQRWLNQAYMVYHTNQIRLKQNQENICKIQHRNRLSKEAALHAKKMGQYLQDKYIKSKRQAQKRQKQQIKQFQQIIQQSKQRTTNLLQQIQILEQEVNQQKNKQKQLHHQKKLRQARRLKHKNNKPSQRDMKGPYPYYVHNYPHMNHGYNYYNYHQYPPHYSPHYSPQYQYYSPQQQKHKYGHADLDSNDSRTASLLYNIKKQSINQQTPGFISKASYDQRLPTMNSNAFDSNPILQALAAQIGGFNISTTKSESQNPQSGRSIVKNQQQISSKLLSVPSMKIKSKKKVQQIKINEANQLDQSVLYSPTNRISTPNFYSSLKFEGFSGLIQKKATQTGKNSSKNNSSRRSSNNHMLQSNVLIDVEQSMLAMSKYSVQKKRKKTESNIKQSTIKIETGEEESRSGQASLIQEYADRQGLRKNKTRARSPTQQVQNKNSSFQKIIIEDTNSSEIFNKPLVAPPNLLTGKKLRKVTEQQSDLFDSEGQPRSAKKLSINRNKNADEFYQISDVVLDKSNLKNSEVYSSGKFQTNNIKQEQIVSNLNFSKKRITQQQQDDDDIMNVNLLAVSKISKQKQYSQKQFKTIYDESQVPKRIPSSIHKSQSMVRKSLRPAPESIQQKQQNQIAKVIERRKVRKSSGSRFSLVQQNSKTALQ